MARVYADENIRRSVVETLRLLGHDVLTAFEAGQANQKIPDENVLQFSISEQRVLLTYNRKHFIRLHQINPVHFGIVVCTEDDNVLALAQRIHEAISIADTKNQIFRINRPNP
jgi:uncharacterized protein with PIN domain